MKKREAIEQLMVLMEGFICRKDTSIQVANEIEGLIAGEFRDNNDLMELADTLAQYSPNGGEGLLTYEEIKYQLVDCLKEVWNLEKLTSRHS